MNTDKADMDYLNLPARKEHPRSTVAKNIFRE
jgi:hypothetical protein